jgi:hypothetical protein
MYQVTKTTHIAGQTIRIDWSYDFLTEYQAIDCLMRHASDLSLEVREDQYYAYSDGIKPEIEIEIVQINN